MNKLIDYFARQNVLITLLSLGTLIIGLVATTQIRREVFPNVDMDLVTITTVYPGASAEVVERYITNPLETDITEIDGIKRQYSVSREGLSFIILQVDPDQTDADEVKDEAITIIDAFDELPEDAQEPVVKALESKLTPTIEVVLGSELPEAEVRDKAKFLKREILRQVQEVARVEYNGVRDLEIRVEADAQKLQQLRVSLPEIIRALQASNVSLPGGHLEGTEANNFKEYIVRTEGAYKDKSDISGTVIRANSLGEVITIGDVAQLRDDFEDTGLSYRINGQAAISLTVMKKESADAITMVDRIKEVLGDLEPQLGKDVSVRFVNDQSYFVRRRIAVLGNNLLVGLLLVMLVLSLILPVRVGLITAFGIPFSFLGTMLVFQYYGMSINLITMMGLIIVAGMLVDDAIVVTENCQRLREKGLEPMEAAIKGTQEVWAPVTVSVSTTIMAFAPLMVMAGIFGKFVEGIPIAVIIALLISLFECFFVLPHHVAHFSGKKATAADGGPLLRFWNNLVVPGYKKLVSWCLRGRYAVVALALLVVGGTLFVAKTHMRFILFPPGAVEVFYVNLDAPSGSSLNQTAKLIAPIEQQILQLPRSEVKNITTEVGRQRKEPGDPTERSGAELAQVKVYLTPETDRDRSANEIVKSLRQTLVYDKSQVDQLTFQLTTGGPPVGKPVNIGVNGEHYEDILPAVAELQQHLGTLQGVSEITNSYAEGKEELHVEVDRTRLAVAGLGLRDVATTLRAAVEGVEATHIRQLDEQIAIRVSLSKQDRQSAERLGDILIANQRGALIPLSQIAKFSKKRGIASYYHKGCIRQVTVSAEIDTNVATSNQINGEMARYADTIAKNHPKVHFEFMGESEDTAESLASLKQAFFYSMFGIALILILLFKNILQPLVVMATIPLGVVAVIWGFFIRDMPLSFLGAIGMVALGGVIVNNAIVFVDFINQDRLRGASRRSSIIDAAALRLRPIFLTTLTTVAGILPTAYGWGGKDPFVVPIATALGWGMAFGSLLTALALPAIVAVADDVWMAAKKIGGVFSR